MNTQQSNKVFGKRWEGGVRFSYPSLSVMLVVLLSTAASGATNWYVALPASGGDDLNPGTLAAPLATIQEAMARVQPGDEVCIRAGTYRELVRPTTAGLTNAPIVIRAYDPDDVGPLPPESVIVAGTAEVEPGVGGAGTWELIDAGLDLYRIQLTANHGMGTNVVGRNQVFWDGEPMTEARWPNAETVIESSFRNMAVSESGSTFDSSSGGPLAGYSGTFFTGSYVANGLPSGSWAGAIVDLAAGNAVWNRSGVVTTSTADRVTFRYPATADESGEGDRFFLWNSLAAVDQAGECFFDAEGVSGPAFALYLIPPDSTHPTNAVVEMRVERVHPTSPSQVDDRLFHLNTANYHLQDLTLLAGDIKVNSTARGTRFTRVTHRHGAQTMNLIFPAASGIIIEADDTTIVDSFFGECYGNGISLQEGSNIVVRNTVIADCSRLGVVTTPSIRDSLIESNTIFRIGSSGMSIKARNTRYAYNNIWDYTMRLNDKAAMNANSTGDGENSEVAYNFVHTAFAIKNGTRGIRLDAGYNGVTGNSNYRIHHNVVWNLGGDTSITIWGVPETGPNYSNANIRVYNNSLERDLALPTGSQNNSLGGFDIRNNVAQSYRPTRVDDADEYLNAADYFEYNHFQERSYTGNFSGDPGYCPYTLTPCTGSPLIDQGTAIPPYTDGFIGLSPDIGAFEVGADPWNAGAHLRSDEVDDLTYVFIRTATGRMYVETGNHARGRLLPAMARLRLDGTVVTDHVVHGFDLDAGAITAQFDFEPGLVEGTVTVEIAPDGVTWADTGQQLTIPAANGFVISDADITAIDASTTNTVSIPVQGLAGHSLYLSQVEFDRLVGSDLSIDPVPVIMDTQSLIAAGKLQPDASDLRFLRLLPERPVEHWIESGLNSTRTLIWLRLPPGDTSQGDTTVYAAYGNPALTNAADPAVFTDAYPATELSSLTMWLAANDMEGALTNLAPVAAWADRSGSGYDAVQTNATARPTFERVTIQDLPTVHFNGSSHNLVVPAASNTAPVSLYIVYHNPDPGAETIQRLVSSGPGPDSGSNGLVYSADLDTQVNNVRLEWIRIAPDKEYINLTLGRKADPPDVFILNPRWYRGYIAEILIFKQKLVNSDSGNVRDYLDRKWGIGGSHARGQVNLGTELPPLEVYVDGQRTWDFQVVDGTNLLVTVPPSAASDLPSIVDLQVGDTNLPPLFAQITPAYGVLYPGSDPAGDASSNGVANLTQYFAGYDISDPFVEAGLFYCVLSTNTPGSVSVHYRKNRDATDVLQWIEFTNDMLGDWTAVLAGPSNSVKEIDDVDGDGLTDVWSYDLPPGGNCYTRVRLQLLVVP